MSCHCATRFSEHRRRPSLNELYLTTGLALVRSVVPIAEKEPTLAEPRPVSLRIPPSGFEDLAQLAENASRLEQILLLLKECQQSIDEFSAVKFLSEKTGLSEVVARDVLDGLASLRGLMVRHALTEDQVISAIDASIDTSAPSAWASRYSEKWKAAHEQIVLALKSIPAESPLSLYQKIKELTYSHQHVLTDITLVTDLRPVFNHDADQVRAVVLTHVLTISYQDGTNLRRIEFATDAADVLKLQRITERAQKKIAAIRKATDNQNAFQLIVAGQAASD